LIALFVSSGAPFQTQLLEIFLLGYQVTAYSVAFLPPIPLNNLNNIFTIIYYLMDAVSVSFLQVSGTNAGSLKEPFLTADLMSA
jgi:hypothetical protein